MLAELILDCFFLSAFVDGGSQERGGGQNGQASVSANALTSTCQRDKLLQISSRVEQGLRGMASVETTQSETSEHLDALRLMFRSLLPLSLEYSNAERGGAGGRSTAVRAPDMLGTLERCGGSVATRQAPSVMTCVRLKSHVWCGSSPRDIWGRSLAGPTALWRPTHMENAVRDDGLLGLRYLAMVLAPGVSQRRRRVV